MHTLKRLLKSSQPHQDGKKKKNVMFGQIFGKWTGLRTFKHSPEENDGNKNGIQREFCELGIKDNE